MNPHVLRLQTELLRLGFDPGKLDGLRGPKTRAALDAFRESKGLKKIAGDKSSLKPKERDFTQPAYLQIHQTDYWAGDRVESIDGMKTNFYVSTKAAYEIHRLSAIVVDNYSDFAHVEVSWVSESRKTVREKGRTYHREAGVWTPEREALLEIAVVCAVFEFWFMGVDPLLITHRQTYKWREIDPDPEIAQATYQIAKRHGFKLDFDWVRGSGKSAALWYPAGCGALRG